MSSLDDISAYYKQEVERLTSTDYSIECLKRNLSSAINITNLLIKNEGSQQSLLAIKDNLTLTANTINQLQENEKITSNS